MKKAIKINISGVIFHIDEDAYVQLKSYLKSVDLYFSNKEGGKEIIDDIESRIAELFQSRVTEQKKEVINLEDVTEVTAIMGDPSDFVEEAEDSEMAGETVAGGEKRSYRRGAKRLYRDPENAVFGGVCGGLGAYFRIDPVILRILFVVLLIAGYGVWGLVYIVLWIAIPKAVSIAQKLEMRGEHVTISNIEKTVKQEYEGVKSNFKNIEKSEGYKQATSAIEEIFRVFGRILVVIAKVLLVLVGVALVFAGFIVLMSFLGVFFFKSTIFSFGWFEGSIFPLSQFLSAFVDPGNLSIILIALFFAVIIPLIMIIYGGIKLIFQIRSRDRGIGIVALVLWIASISVLFSMGFIESRNFVYRGVSQENVVIDDIPSRTLYLRLNENVDVNSLEDLTWFSGSRRGGIYRHRHSGPPASTYSNLGDIYQEQGNGGLWSSPSLSIRYSSADEPDLVVEKRARGSSQFYSELNAEAVTYNVELTDSLLIFDHMFTPGAEDLWNFAEVNIRLNLPEGYSVHIGEKMNRILTSARNTDDFRLSSMTGRDWMMTEEGLTLKTGN